MPPKRAAAAAAKRRFQEADEDEELDELTPDSGEPEAENSEEEEKPRKKAKKPAAPKQPAKKQATPKKAPAAVSSPDGWFFEPPSLIYKDYGTQPNTKIAGFDLDGTLVNVKSGSQFPRNAQDWKWFNKKAPDVVRSYHERGYKVVLFTNQGGIKKAVDGKAAANFRERCDAVVQELGIPVQVFAAAQADSNRKPASGMWDFLCARCNAGVQPDKSASFYVGDAAGRPLDIGDTDKGFAAAVGIPFRMPEDEFGEMDGKRAVPTAAKKAAEGAAGGDGEAGEGANPQLAELFGRLADKAFAGTGQNDRFKAISHKKVAGILKSYPEKITLDNVKKLKVAGIGEASKAKIKEFLETGKCAELEETGAEEGAAAGGTAAPALKNPGQAMANKFM